MMFSFLNPYLLFIKIGAAIALFAGLLFAWHQVVESFREQGRDEVHAAWAKADLIRQTAEQELIQKRNEDNARQLLLYEAKNQEVRREYARRIELQNRNNARDIADLRAAGGLRIKLPSTVCSGFASQANAQSTGLDNENGTSRLPEQIENGLLQFAVDRDQEIIQLGACQKWIRDNGLYPE
jgi:hypothetical protein